MSALAIEPAVPVKERSGAHKRVSHRDGDYVRPDHPVSARVTPLRVVDSALSADDIFAPHNIAPLRIVRESGMWKAVHSSPRHGIRHPRRMVTQVQSRTTSPSYWHGQVGRSGARSALAGSLESTLRILVMVLMSGVALLAGMAIVSALGLNAANADTVRVQEGQSLTSIASLVMTDRPRADVISDIRSMNGLDSDQIRVGQELLLPTY
ncbi:LysM peptidoglycan-binding domain-containing protein [Arcanobacterium canis]